MTVVPGDDDRPDRTAAGESPDAAAGTGPKESAAARDRAWRSNPSDDDVDAAFADIVSGMITDSVRRHPSGVAPVPPAVEPRPGPEPAIEPDPAAERARRRELRRLERAAELAAYTAGEEQARAEHEADQEHFTPPDPPPLPRPKLRTISSVLMIMAGILLLTRPGVLAVSPDLAMVLAVVLIVGGAVLLLTGIWRRRGGGDGWDDGAVV